MESVGARRDNDGDLGANAVRIGQGHSDRVVFLAQRTQRVQGDDVLLGLADLKGGGIRDLESSLGGLVGVRPA